jgi:hypothetical protein
MFRNDKGDNPARPDYRGRCTVDGASYKISGWVRTAQQSGQKYLSLAFTPDAPAPPAPATPDVPLPQEDDLPF